MQIHGSPVTVSHPQDAEMADRFWYWQGSSGRKYIHSVYALDLCPPLPSAIYVGVKRAGHLRIAVTVGRFLPFWDKALPEAETTKFEELGVDEIHVHLLARDPVSVEAVMRDLGFAMGGSAQLRGLSESESPLSYAA